MSDDVASLAGAAVSLREVTAESLRAVVGLQVAPAQRPLVASNVFSIAQAYFNKDAWFRAIYGDETPVGFVMLADPTLPGATNELDLPPGDIWLWRFMFDQRYQRLGFGGKSLDLIRAHVRTRPGAKRLLASYVPAENGPEPFYMKYGFQKTGRLVANDTEVEIWIAP